MENTGTSIQQEKRFEFGRNWAGFLSVLSQERILEAEKSLQQMLGVKDLKGLRFLDIGSGSGLFSLAARRMGAEVFSFDYDPHSVKCTQNLKDKFFPDDKNWTVERGSVLDVPYVKNLGQFDVVYSWGVLHHTGQMWKALEIATMPLKLKGKLFIALYNDQGWLSRFWWIVKSIYNTGSIGRMLVCAFFIPVFIVRASVKSVLKGQNEFTQYKKSRGMSIYYDWFDWLGGLPFEVASVDATKNFYESRGFSLQKVIRTTSWGNNQFVFQKDSARQ